MGDQDRDTGAEPPRQPEAPADIPPAPSASAPRPRDWTPRATTAQQPGLGAPPMADLRPLGEEPDPFASRSEAPPQAPARRRPGKEERASKPRKPLFRRIAFWILKAILAFLAVSIGMVAIYRFVPPPITWTQIGDIVGGHGATKRWMSIDRIDPNMTRAAIAAEDARFCTHHGFDLTAIEQAYARNQQGGRIRGGSTISQQTAKNVFLFQGADSEVIARGVPI